MVKSGDRNIEKQYIYLGKQAKCARATEDTGTFLETHRDAGSGLNGADRWKMGSLGTWIILKINSDNS